MRSNIKPCLRRLPNRSAFNLAWPMIVGNLSQPVMGLADTAMLGHLASPIYMGAVAIGANLLALLFWMFSFLRMGTTSLTAHGLGAQDKSEISNSLLRSGSLAFLLGGILVGIQWLIVPIALRFIAPNAEILALAESYCTIRIYSAPAVFMTYVITGWLIGLQNTKLPLYIALTANCLNIFLDYLFILHFNMDSDGAAYASLIAEYCALAFALLVSVKKWRALELNLSTIHKILSLIEWVKLLRLNADLFIRTAILLTVFNFFTAQGGQFGEVTLAANALIMQFVLFVAFGLDGYAHAAEAMTAKALGERKLIRFYQACLATTLPALAIAIFLTAVFVFFTGNLISLLSDIEEVVASAHAITPWLYVLPLASVWCYLLDGIFIGARQTRIMRNLMVCAVFMVFLPAWLVLQPFGNHGLWAAFTLFNIFRGLSLGTAFYMLSKRKSWF